MGGSGSPTSYVKPTDVDKLEDIARREIEIKKEKTELPRRRVFISFYNEDLDLVNLFRGQAKNENSDLDFIDFSVTVPYNSENAEYVKRGIRQRIDQTSVTVVIIGEKTYQSEWVDWEIRESIRRGKGVVAIRSTDDPSLVIPQALIDHGITPIPWNHKLINEAINEAAQKRLILKDFQ
jgi:hypothetical protein